MDQVQSIFQLIPTSSNKNSKKRGRPAKKKITGNERTETSVGKEKRVLQTGKKSTKTYSEKLAVKRKIKALALQNETPVKKKKRLEREKKQKAALRQNETPIKKRKRLEKIKANSSLRRLNESSTEKEGRQERQRILTLKKKLEKWEDQELGAFNYNPTVSYESNKLTTIGNMDVVCEYCQAMKWKGESSGMCCNNGKTKLNPLNDPPEPLKSILDGSHNKSNEFLESARTYNSAFQMTSFGADSIIDYNYMPTFKIQGQIYHRIGSLLPSTASEKPKFLQIYFMGNDQSEVQRRCKTFPTLDPLLTADLQKMLHSNNNYVKDFKTAMENQTTEDFKVVIKENKNLMRGHKGQYNPPSVNEVAVLILGQEFEKRDIVLHSRTDQLQRVSELHRSYDALQYPLIFCTGEDGYNIYMPQHNPKTQQPNENKKISAIDFYSYRLMIRVNVPNRLLLYRQLSNQYFVDMYAKIESERLSYIRNNQTKLRVENYIHLKDAINNDADTQNVGQMVLLPSSFTGGPRYMHERTQDAMTYVRKYGTPDLFITFTCNPKWTEITENLKPGQKPQDRHDMICRIFKLKVNNLMDLIKKGRIFGAARCYMYTIEWQKRGLPHAHILIWLKQKICSNKIDSFISAEIPDPNADPILHEIIKNNMVHGPCGSMNKNSQCMQEGKCTKKYPKSFVKETKTGDDGYPTYKRRSPQDGGLTVQIKSRGKTYVIDNKWIVPYCPLLSRIFKAHINVEFCNSVKSIKYVCKYINKGSDQATFVLVNPKDEIQKYQSGRYISTSEAIWRILSFPIHERFPAVIHLSVHLENGQRIYFSADNVLQKLQEPPATTLTAFFQLCKTDEFAKNLYYHEIPSYYTWDGKRFNRRKQGTPVPGHPGIKKDEALGRVYTVHPNNTECYFLRLLLHKIKGPTSFDFLKRVNGHQHPTFQSACKSLGLLENDDHWGETLKEACVSQAPIMIRDLFVTILAFCFVTDANSLWHDYKTFMSEDILHRLQKQNPNTSLTYNDDIFNETLILIDDKLQTVINKSVKDYGLPLPNHALRQHINKDYLREMSYDINELQQYVEVNEKKLLPEQMNAYKEILESVDGEKGNLFFLDAPGGTGKTFLINLLLSKIRSRKKIALAVASSGIAATLLKGGRTAHSVFNLPLNVNYTENPFCNIKKNSFAAILLIASVIIFWDEATMSHKKLIEALNRTLQDLTGKKHLMGGKTVVLSGDFRQTLPIIQRGTRADEVQASIKSSFLFSHIKIFSLSVNMRVHLNNDANAGEFAKLLLQIGDGKVPEEEGEIDLSKIGNLVFTLQDLIISVYPNLKALDTSTKSQEWLCDRAILSPKNEKTNEINEHLLSSFPGEENLYLSIDTATSDEGSVNYPVELLNSLNPPGLPQHQLKLKKGAPIMLLRNLDAPRLCNGTRLQINNLKSHLIEATVLTGCAKGEHVFIPRIPLIPNDFAIPFKRLQFPIKLCFAMTINKAQGQSFNTAGVDLREPCFSHGQLYVACSRISQKRNLFLLTSNGKSSNIVYKEALL